MKPLMYALWVDEAGLIISAELVVIATLGVLGLVAGVTYVRDAVAGEYQDVGNSLRSLNQSYSYGGMKGCKSWTAGSQFIEGEEPRKIDFPEVYEPCETDCPPAYIPQREVIVEPPCLDGCQTPCPQQEVIQQECCEVHIHTDNVIIHSNGVTQEPVPSSAPCPNGCDGQPTPAQDDDLPSPSSGYESMISPPNDQFSRYPNRTRRPLNQQTAPMSTVW